MNEILQRYKYLYIAVRASYTCIKELAEWIKFLFNRLFSSFLCTVTSLKYLYLFDCFTWIPVPQVLRSPPSPLCLIFEVSIKLSSINWKSILIYFKGGVFISRYSFWRKIALNNLFSSGNLEATDESSDGLVDAGYRPSRFNPEYRRCRRVFHIHCVWISSVEILRDTFWPLKLSNLSISFFNLNEILVLISPNFERLHHRRNLYLGTTSIVKFWNIAVGLLLTKILPAMFLSCNINKSFFTYNFLRYKFFSAANF